jgi:hypothetical protein
MELYNLTDPLQDLRKKKSERVIINKLLNKRMGVDNKKAVEIIKNVSSKTGLSPSFIAANAFQEGMNMAIQDDNVGKSSGYFSENVDESVYPVDGFMDYGLDTFGDSVDVLKGKGYLPKNFDFMPYKTRNEKRQPITTGAFRNNEDALLAKAAYIKHFKDQVNQYSGEKKIRLEPRTVDYLTMSAYNAGFGNARKMIDELASGKVSQKDYIDKGLTSLKGVHKNISPRMEKMGWIDKMISGPVPSSNPFPMNAELITSIYK